MNNRYETITEAVTNITVAAVQRSAHCLALHEVPEFVEAIFKKFDSLIPPEGK